LLGNRKKKRLDEGRPSSKKEEDSKVSSPGLLAIDMLE
jgi:hypothetical protein